MSDHVKGMTSCRPPENEISNEKSNKSQMDLINRIECAIRHIQTATDVDPWAVEIAVEAMEKQIPKKVVQNKGLINPVWVENAHLCPVCFSWAGSFGYCSKCGQAIDRRTSDERSD